MAIKKVNREWNPYLGDYKRDFIVDTEADVANLPECSTGSSALVIESGAVYIVNTSGNWVAFGG